MRTQLSDDYLRNWEVAISHYLQCFKWSVVAEKMNLDKTTIYAWLKEPLFKEMLNEAKSTVIAENQDKLRNDADTVYSEMMWAIKQRDDLTAKIKAIQEFNKMFDNIDAKQEIRKSVELLEEIRDNANSLKTSES